MDQASIQPTLACTGVMVEVVSPPPQRPSVAVQALAVEVGLGMALVIPEAVTATGEEGMAPGAGEPGQAGGSGVEAGPTGPGQAVVKDRHWAQILEVSNSNSSSHLHSSSHSSHSPSSSRVRVVMGAPKRRVDAPG